MGVFHAFYIVQMVPNRATHHISGKFSEMDTGTEEGEFVFSYGHKIMIEVRVYFKQEI